MDLSEVRIEKREECQMIPKKVDGEEGLVIVDATWGRIQPMQADESVITVGELEALEHQEKNMQIIDARFHESSGTPTINCLKG